MAGADHTYLRAVRQRHLPARRDTRASATARPRQVGLNLHSLCCVGFLHDLFYSFCKNEQYDGYESHDKRGEASARLGPDGLLARSAPGGRGASSDAQIRAVVAQARSQDVRHRVSIIRVIVIVLQPLTLLCCVVLTWMDLFVIS